MRFIHRIRTLRCYAEPVILSLSKDEAFSKGGVDRSPRFPWSLAKTTFLLVLTLFIFWSCDWAPDKVEFEGETQYRSINLVLGDSVAIEIPGYDLVVENTNDLAVVQVDALTDSQARIIGKGVGETQVLLRYSLFINEGSDQQAMMYLDVTVSEGLPLKMFLGEWISIRLSDYLSSLQIEQIDSIAYSFPTDSLNIDMLVQISDTSISLNSNHPGFLTIEITGHDSLKNQVSSLKFETQTVIRTRVLAEIFTNAGCINCPTVNHNLDLLYEASPENFITIRYHVFWTDPNDPMNLYNPNEVEERRVFYGNSYEAPRLFINGTPISDYESYGSLSSTVNQYADRESDVHIWKPSHNESTEHILINYSIQNYAEELRRLVCWTVLTEDSIYYAGTNGETIHMQVMKDMQKTEIPFLTGTIRMEDTLIRPPDYEINDKYQIVMFLQDLNTQEILQAASYSIPELLPTP